jgi:phosphopantothenoylcysteine synthetase/decarboxylase
MGMRYNWGLGVGHQYAHTTLLKPEADRDLRRDEMLTGEQEDDVFGGHPDEDEDMDYDDDDDEWSRPFT